MDECTWNFWEGIGLETRSNDRILEAICILIWIQEYYVYFAYLQQVKLLFPTCRHYNADDFNDEPDFSIQLK